MSENRIDALRVRPFVTFAHVERELYAIEQNHGAGAASIFVAAPGEPSLFWTHDVGRVRWVMQLPKMGRVTTDAEFFGPRGEKLERIIAWRAWLTAELAAARGLHCSAFDPATLVMARHGDNCMHPFKAESYSAPGWQSYVVALTRYRDKDKGRVA